MKQLMVLATSAFLAVALIASPSAIAGGDPCEGDVDGDGVVGLLDLLAVVSSFGDCPDPPDPCPEDLNDDGAIDFQDLLIVLSNFGPCEGDPCESPADCDDGDDCTIDICVHGACHHIEIPDCGGEP